METSGKSMSCYLVFQDLYGRKNARNLFTPILGR